MADQSVFVPPGFDPPTGLVAGGLRLEPLGPQHNERDFAAWTSSMDHIRRSPGFDKLRDWPREMSLAENRSDLERHAQDFAERAGFTYSVLDGVNDVVGCLYIYPADDGIHDAKVFSWVRVSQAGQDGALRRAVADWLTSDAWPFARPLYEPLLA